MHGHHGLIRHLTCKHNSLHRESYPVFNLRRAIALVKLGVSLLQRYIPGLTEPPVPTNCRPQRYAGIRQHCNVMRRRLIKHPRHKPSSREPCHRSHTSCLAESPDGMQIRSFGYGRLKVSTSALKCILLARKSATFIDERLVTSPLPSSLALERRRRG